MTEHLPQQAVRVIIPAEPECIPTERLLLRPIQAEDAPAIFEIRSRPEVTALSWPRTADQTIQDTEKWMRKKTYATPDASGAVQRRFQFAIVQADDPAERIIGTTGINSLVPAPSVGYGIHPDFWGMGYATEAVLGVVDAWSKVPRIPIQGLQERLFACCNKANVGSVRVLEKSGFSAYDETNLGGDTVVFWQMDMPS